MLQTCSRILYPMAPTSELPALQLLVSGPNQRVHQRETHAGPPHRVKAAGSALFRESYVRIRVPVVTTHVQRQKLGKLLGCGIQFGRVLLQIRAQLVVVLVTIDDICAGTPQKLLQSRRNWVAQLQHRHALVLQ